MSDEQRVRTMCGWIGVEISKSRARKGDNPESGLYRVRGSGPIRRALHTVGPDMKSFEWGEWTAYAFTLGEIERAVGAAIANGSPSGPQEMGPRDALTGETVRVPTRWTSGYRGRRDLGSVWRAELLWGVKTETAAALSVRVWESMSRAEQEAHGMAQMLDRNYLRNKLGAQTPRQRQRAQNAEFHAEHMERRKYGLRARHAAKLRHNASRLLGNAVDGPEGPVGRSGKGEGLSGPQNRAEEC